MFTSLIFHYLYSSQLILSHNRQTEEMEEMSLWSVCVCACVCVCVCVCVSAGPNTESLSPRNRESDSSLTASLVSAVPTQKWNRSDEMCKIKWWLLFAFPLCLCFPHRNIPVILLFSSSLFNLITSLSPCYVCIYHSFMMFPTMSETGLTMSSLLASYEKMALRIVPVFLLWSDSDLCVLKASALCNSGLVRWMAVICVCMHSVVFPGVLRVCAAVDSSGW